MTPEALSPAPVKLLLVDDLEENLLALSALLEGPDLTLLRARSGREALELLLVHDVALALIDVQMPEIDGFELAELMRGSERTRRVPIILMTAGLRESHRVFKGYESGAVDFLFKPVDVQILRHKVDTFVELHRQRLELSRQVAKLKESEELTSRLHRELQETLRFNETFIAVVGHDLRNPLNVILMAAEVMLRRGEDAGMKRAADQVRSSGRRMMSILDDLSDLARARLGGGIVVQREPADLLALARKVVAESRTSHAGRNVELLFSGSFEGEWDGPRIEQVLSNLIGNALRHGTPEGTVTVDIDGRSPDRVAVSVHNLGYIPEDILPHVFQPFRQGEPRRTRSEGLGLGLFIVRHLVEAHAGSIRLDSNPTAGTTFRIELPRSAGRSTPGSASSPS